MALIPINERVETTGPLFEVAGYGGHSRKVAYPVNEIIQEIQDAAQDAGLSSDRNLFKIFSGYRSDARQQGIFDKKVATLQDQHPEMSLAQIHKLARKTVAKPGSSSHRTGYAFDIYLGHKTGLNIANTSRQNTAYIESTPAYAFLREIAPKYGISQLGSEPWHWECDRACREAFINRDTHLNNDNGETPVASTKRKVAVALIGVSCVTALVLGGWILFTKQK